MFCFVGNFTKTVSKFQKSLSQMALLLKVFESTRLCQPAFVSVQLMVILEKCRSIFVLPLFLNVNYKDKRSTIFR